jgi:hypothetical protein
VRPLSLIELPCARDAVDDALRRRWRCRARAWCSTRSRCRPGGPPPRDAGPRPDGELPPTPADQPAPG